MQIISTNKSTLKFIQSLIGFIIFLGSMPSYADGIPDYYQEPGLNDTREYSVADKGTEYIDPFTGILRLTYKDLVIPGNGGLDIVINRVYQVSHQRSGVVGYTPYHDGRTTTGMGWDMHFGRIHYEGALFPNGCAINRDLTDQNPVLELPDGSKRVLYKKRASRSTDPYIYITKDRWIASCIDEQVYGETNGGMLVTSPAGVKYTINFLQPVKASTVLGQAAPKVWSVTRIEDTNGNWIKIDYKQNSQYAEFDRITTNDGREVAFTYLDAGTDASRLNFISANGQTWEYVYSKEPNQALNYYFLDEVRAPEGVTWNYSYHDSGDGLFSIKQVTSPTAGVTNYTYQNRVANVLVLGSIETTAIKTKTTSGVDVVSGVWDYNFSVSSNLDLTTITTPTGIEKYRHCGEAAIVVQVADCLFNDGSLLSKELYDGASGLLRKETYAWDGIQISDQYDKHPLRSYNRLQVWANHLRKLTIEQDGNTFITEYANHNFYGNPQYIIEDGPVVTGLPSRSTIEYTYNNFIDANTWIIGLIDVEKIWGIADAINVDYIETDNDYYSTGTKVGKLKQVNKYGVITSYDYYPSGDLETETDPMGKVTTYSNYYRGIAKNESHPVDATINEYVTISREVNDTGTIKSETNGEGNKTSYGYDDLNRLTSIVTPRLDDSDTTVIWSSGGRVKTVNRGSFSSVTTEDGFGNTTSTQAEGITKIFEYDAVGQLLFASNPSSTTLGDRYVRDALGRVEQITHVDGATVPTFIQYEYLPGNKIRVTDENSEVTTNTYGSYGDPDVRYLVEINAPESSVTVIERERNGDIRFVYQNGVYRDYYLDTRRYLNFTVGPEVGVTELVHDDSGNMTQKFVNTSEATIFTYDDLNRLKKIDYPLGTDDVDYIYDKNSNLTDLNTAAANWHYVYDSNDNLKEEWLTTNGVIHKIIYTYDARDNLSSVQYPNGQVINYSPDDLGRATQISGFVNSLDYHPNFQVHNINFANGKTTTISQNTRLWPERFNTGAISNVIYGYDNAGNVDSYTDDNNLLNNRSMAYDGLNRLRTLSGSAGTGTINYSIDGNIASKNVDGVDLTYTYDIYNLLDTVTGSKPYAFSYDVYGNVTYNGHDSFVYNDASQLTDITNQNTHFDYDGNNRRVIKHENGQISKIMFYNKAGQLMYETDRYNDAQTVYVYLDSTLIARREFCADQDNDGDGLGSCTEIKLGLNTSLADSDGDGINDGDEDAEGDGMTNIYEATYGLNPQVNDAALDMDADGVNNLAEFILGSYANNPDTDADGMPDGWENTYNLNLLINDASSDPDADLLTNINEYHNGTNPLLADSDGNGINDGNEDPDADGLTNLEETQNGTDPLNSDSDNDGLTDGYEVTNGLNPNNGLDALDDTDNDGLTNLEELQYGTDPNNPDTDGDGVNDGDEITAGTDPLAPLFNPAVLVPIIYLILF